MNGSKMNASRQLPRARDPSALLLHLSNSSTTNSAAAARPLARQAPRAAAVEAPHLWIPDQSTHSLTAKGRDVIDSMGSWAQKKLLPYLKPIEHSWQPTDWLPDASSPDFYDQVRELRSATANLPADYLVVLVGDMVTEEALPSYMNMLNLNDGASDETGAQSHPWAVWTRKWTAEENRHGDLLNKYLYLSGKVDMKAIEVTIQNLISHGLDPRLENNPYLCFVYTSFQERATKLSHGNTARLAGYHGDNPLAKICGIIAADEARHEQAYQAIVDELFERDPDGAMLAFADMMKKGIVMPAHLMDDNWHGSANSASNAAASMPGGASALFMDYAAVADNLGVYTTNDYADIVDHLMARWRVSERQVTSGEAAAAQEYLCKHAPRIRRLSDLTMERRLRDRQRGKLKTANFSWVFKQEVPLM